MKMEDPNIENEESTGLNERNTVQGIESRNFDYNRELDLNSEAHAKPKFDPEKFMEIVMKRKLGDNSQALEGSLEENDSPNKKLKQDLVIEKHYSQSRNESENEIESPKRDEVDGSIANSSQSNLDNVEESGSNDSNSIENVQFKDSVEGKPRIAMFDDQESRSSDLSGSFTLNSFKSLNSENKSSGINEGIFQHNEINRSEDNSESHEHVQDEMFVKIKQQDSKRSSRKQHVPKKLVTEDINDFELVSAENVEDLADEIDDIAPKHKITKHEKSRKQSKPKRIALVERKVCTSVEKNPQEILDVSEDVDAIYESQELSIKANTDHIEDRLQVDVDAGEHSVIASDITGTEDSKSSDCVSELAEGNDTYYSTVLKSSPLLGNDGNEFQKQLLGLGLSTENIDLLNKLSPSLLKTNMLQVSADGINSERENLEVIRQLREFRSHKYRKIAISEKKEIAEYAKSNGVTQAANIYNVSKSAVSMWTRQDLDSLEEIDERRRKNCMVGNEKFEALCVKVREHKESKFKGLSKQDKFEVSRFAKLVGVREMARCLDVALGTVSGWMRQFPYVVKGEEEVSNSSFGSSNQDEENGAKQLETLGKSSRQLVFDENGCAGSSSKPISKARRRKSGKTENEIHEAHFQTETKSRLLFIKPKVEINDEPVDATPKDEIDHMIENSVVMYKPPDIDKLYEESKDQMASTELENNEEFKALFYRVVQCKGNKYKHLSADDKMEVCRYGKRVGVRKVGKILGLATGTLSGWNTKYHVYLSPASESVFNKTSPQLDVSSSSNLSEHDLSNDGSSPFGNSSVCSTQSPSMLAGKSPLCVDGVEKSEVTAIKCLFKEKFDDILKKIEVARSVKFKNITIEEKIEIVKCSKLVGIRPTARVLNIPIGTLSGWITKYSRDLHPAYNVNDNSAIKPGSVPSFPGNMGLSIPGASFGILPTMTPYMVPGLGQMIGVGNSGASSNMYSHLMNVIEENSSQESSSNEHSIQESSSHESSSVEKLKRHLAEREGKVEEMEKKVRTVGKGTNSSHTATNGTDDGFEDEAQRLAQQYLQAAYRQLGIPLM
ncbi:uncharacterized protein LOC128222529 [Mya arenaria]|uniref:uncharacterized protein LOC128222529 n=1 Tax=Mya arenaria TaxID=6604 RepID=UPI0022E76881|nr:uncharacterized protein LOC128222529 [Mya arenaria]XP_052787536.1 uncharacterized protein LOC128222529 [Mya arenaria]